MQPKPDPRDARDLEILRRAAGGQAPNDIAYEMGILKDIVREVLLEDRRAFPDEPLEPVH